MAHLLEVRNLKTRFQTAEGTVHAVNGISYTLDEGESIGIVGESGSGKSVGVMSIMGLIPSRPSETVTGEVLLDGNDILKLPPSQMKKIRGKDLAMVFQDPMTSLNPVLTVGRQMTEGLELHMNMSRSQANERAAEVLSLVGIPNPLDRLNDYPHEFSGGQRQRIGIAMALTCEPRILIGDEPTTALDVTIQAQIIGLVNKLKKKLGMAIIWITHDLGVVSKFVDKVAVMYSGTIVELAPVRGIYNATSHPYTLGLLESLPQISATGKQRLIPIDGLPPDLLERPTHCPFAPRCRFAAEQCWAEIPTLTELADGHSSACFRAAEIRDGLRKGDKKDMTA